MLIFPQILSVFINPDVPYYGLPESTVEDFRRSFNSRARLHPAGIYVIF